MRAAFAVLVAFSLGASAGAQPRGLTPEQRDAILSYRLTLDRANQLIAAMTEVTQYLVSLPDYKERLARSATLTAAERIAQMERDPKTANILKQHSLSGREYLVGVPALRMALQTAQGLSSPNVVASPENVAFAKANLAQLKPKMDQADAAGRRP